MSKKQLEESKKDFCCIYLDTLDANRAAQQCGVENGYEMLRQKDIQQYLKQTRKSVREMVQMEDVLRRLCQIAFSQPNDAVALACGQQYDKIENLDLAAVAEFKRKDEQTEVKFIDRVRALQVLGELLSGKESNADDTARDFFRALELSGESKTGDGSA